MLYDPKTRFQEEEEVEYIVLLPPLAFILAPEVLSKQHYSTQLCSVAAVIIARPLSSFAEVLTP